MLIFWPPYLRGGCDPVRLFGFNELRFVCVALPRLYSDKTKFGRLLVPDARRALSRRHGVTTGSKTSPGRQFSAAHVPSRLSNRMPLTLPDFSKLMFCSVMPTALANARDRILRNPSISSGSTTILTAIRQNAQFHRRSLCTAQHPADHGRQGRHVKYANRVARQGHRNQPRTKRVLGK